MTTRSRLLLGTAAALSFPHLAAAQQRASLADPLRLGADHSLMDSGLAPALLKAFGRDTGVAPRSRCWRRWSAANWMPR